METQALINAAFTAATAVTGWFARELWTAVKELRGDMAKLREELPTRYIAREDYRADLREIKEMLGKIFDRLESKADKP